MATTGAGQGGSRGKKASAARPAAPEAVSAPADDAPDAAGEPGAAPAEDVAQAEPTEPSEPAAPEAGATATATKPRTTKPAKATTGKATTGKATTGAAGTGKAATARTGKTAAGKTAAGKATTGKTGTGKATTGKATTGRTTTGKAGAGASSGTARAARAAASQSTARKSAKAPAPAPTGEQPREIGGYRILDALGSGGMGAVFRAVDGDGRTVALKLLHAHLDDPEARERLRREVAALQKVRHPGVARVLDAEIDSTEAFVVTELVPGRDLGRLVKDDGALPTERVAGLARALREALTKVHDAGVLHRDLTPGNVMVTDDGPVLIDFGLAQTVEDSRVTSAGLVTGTPGYLSPELLDGEDPTPATDWWGWAAVLTFAATGRPPFGSGTVGAVLTRVRAGEPDLADLPRPVAEALRGALAVDPGARTSPDDVVAALERAAQADEAGDADEGTGGWDDDGPDDDADDTATQVLGADDATQVLDGPDLVPTVVGLAAGGTRVLPTDDVAATAVLEAVETGEWEADDDAVGHDGPYADGYDDTGYDDTGYDDAGDDAYGDDVAYGDDAQDDDLDEEYEAEEEYAAFVPPLPRRTGTVAALGAILLAIGLARPGFACAIAVVLAIVARSVELDAEALEHRRARRGARPGDTARAVLTWPWYLARGALGVVPVVVVGSAVVVLVGGVTWWLVQAGHWTVAPLVPGQGSGLLRGNLPWVGRAWVGAMAALGLVMVWFGPTARTHRDGARRVVGALVPRGWPTVAVVAVALAVAGLLADVMLAQDVAWWPLGGPPDLG